MEHIAKVRGIEDDNFREIHHDYNRNIEAKVFQVKSLLSSEGYHNCTSVASIHFQKWSSIDWKKLFMACKHFLTVFEHVPGMPWNSLGEIYIQSPHFSPTITKYVV